MKIGFVGLGRLGLPLATCWAQAHDVLAYDLRKHRRTKGPVAEVEAGWQRHADFNAMLADARHLKFGNLHRVVQESDLVFVCVQTPHEERFEGTTPVDFAERRDFSYEYLKAAVRGVVHETGDRSLTLAVVSTVLPGTMRREVMPLLKGSGVRLVYNPAFPAMGTAVPDFLDPEFWLAGADEEDGDALEVLREAYEALWEATGTRAKRPPFLEMSIESAELAKVAYNCAISTRLGVANALMHLCDATAGADADDVADVLQAAWRRVSGAQYWRGGMGDGGGCHPRDNIAMSWLATQRGVHANPFEWAMQAREAHARWLARLVVDAHRRTGHPMALVGHSYKPESALVTGSHALLVLEYLQRGGWPVRAADPLATPAACELLRRELREVPHVVLLGQRHGELAEWRWAPGSVVVDPHRMVTDQDRVEVVRLGEESRGQ